MCHHVRSRDLCALRGQSVVSPACRSLASCTSALVSTKLFFPSAEMCFCCLSSKTHLKLLFFSQLKPGQSSCLFVWMLIGPGVLCLEFRLEISDCLPTSLLDLWSLFSVGASRNTLKYCKFLIPISNPNTKKSKWNVWKVTQCRFTAGDSSLITFKNGCDMATGVRLWTQQRSYNRRLQPDFHCGRRH